MGSIQVPDETLKKGQQVFSFTFLLPFSGSTHNFSFCRLSRRLHNKWQQKTMKNDLLIWVWRPSAVHQNGINELEDKNLERKSFLPHPSIWKPKLWKWKRYHHFSFFFFVFFISLRCVSFLFSYSLDIINI